MFGRFQKISALFETNLKIVNIPGLFLELSISDNLAVLGFPGRYIG